MDRPQHHLNVHYTARPREVNRTLGGAIVSTAKPGTAPEYRGSGSRRCAAGAGHIAMLAQQEVIGHAGDVVAHHAMPRLARGLAGEIFRHGLRMIHVVAEQLLQRLHGTLPFLDDGRMIVQAAQQQFLERTADRSLLRAEACQPAWRGAYLLDALRAAGHRLRAGSFNQIRGQAVEDALDGVAEFRLRTRGWILSFAG